MKVIIVRRDDADTCWKSYLQENQEIYGEGKTPKEAVGDIVSKNPELFDIGIAW